MPEAATLTARFDEALTYARVHHAGDLRKQTKIPYLSHLLAVSSLVLDMEGSEHEAIAALLHDVVEDGGGPQALAVIRAQFGDDVARIVDAALTQTRTPSRRGASARRPTSPKSPTSLLDLRTHGDELWTRFNKGRDHQLWYCGALADAFLARIDDLGEPERPAAEELRRVMDEIGRVALGDTSTLALTLG